MKSTLKHVASIIEKPEDHIRKNISNAKSDVYFYSNSIKKKDNCIISMIKHNHEQFLMILSSDKKGLITKFSGSAVGGAGIYSKKCELNSHNAAVLKEEFPWTAPISSRNHAITIGCGDRLGIASPGHLAAITQFDAFPILVQQSKKELKFTNRTYHDLIDTTVFHVFQSGYTKGYGADANDLKTITDVNTAIAAGIPMITLNLVDQINMTAMLWSDEKIIEKFSKLPQNIQDNVQDEYIDKTFTLNSTIIKFNVITAKRCAIMYHKLVNHADKIYKHLKSNCEDNFDLELSIDEARFPTWAECHFYIINELSARGVKISAFAPHFIGSFKRGIDYNGNINEFSEHLKSHIDIANAYGGYKISIHTGSNKFKVYPLIGEISDFHFHLKTSGGSWIEALRIIVEKDPNLYRVIHNIILENISHIKKYYKNIKIDMKVLETITSIKDDDILKYIDSDEIRQVLYMSYGIILKNDVLRPLIYSILDDNEEYYHEHIKNTFVKYFEALNIPKSKTESN